MNVKFWAFRFFFDVVYRFFGVIDLGGFEVRLGVELEGFEVVFILGCVLCSVFEWDGDRRAS